MKRWKYKTPGIPDNLFIRGNIPMTKEEVRSVVMAKLRLREDHIVYDIGAGTGSISVEAASQVKEGKIYAVERKEEGIELIKKNARNFCLDNIEIISGQAPYVLNNLPFPDRVVIGGSGGHLKKILNYIDTKIKTGGRVVIMAVTINTLNLAFTRLQNLKYNLDICSIAVTRTREISDYQIFDALNPVFIISGEKEEE